MPLLGDGPKGREDMKQVCSACHSPTFARNHYYQFDGLVELYNEKFAKPIAAVMGELKKNGYITKTPFDDKIEWTWWEIWHHEGRRARHGASMNGPDYTWWHGIYEVAQHFYFKYIPELRKFHNAELDAMIDEVMADPYHNWLNRPTEDIKADIKSGKMAEMLRPAIMRLSTFFE